ncbi:hypothetical protein BZG35_05730 [Brevundimonas sp. LM2]|uniref:L,D-transpeptidase n=1 Tax=Brevundimonas sp. LM2 TaxID=1938605 RepID=UPI000983FF5A|nr:L,D-transpeptidase [Brevundimonas sp. LM2]AQR63376.1 hypothetical protein BZG35_05730 [Brevundimonas sp. LM2]
MAASLKPLSTHVFARLALAALAVLGVQAMATLPASAADGASTLGVPPRTPTQADFQTEDASDDARRTADWIARSGDNQGRPFIIVDKRNTKVFVFDGYAGLQGATVALLGLAVGDESADGVGNRKLSEIRPEERTTPAGRFDASFGLNLAGQDILWIDYDTALALHRVLAVGTRQHRLERRAATSALSRRITFGCINVPVDFYEQVVQRAFAGTVGVVYILPETKPVGEVFPGVMGRI